MISKTKKKIFFFNFLMLIIGLLSLCFNFFFIHHLLIFILIFHILFSFLFIWINSSIDDVNSKNIKNFIFSIILRFVFSLLFLFFIGIFEIENFSLGMIVDQYSLWPIYCNIFLFLQDFYQLENPNILIQICECRQ